MSDSPVGEAIVLCQEIRKDPSTGKLSLIGLFDTILVDEFPSIANLTAFISVTGSSGAHPIDLFAGEEGSDLVLVTSLTAQLQGVNLSQRLSLEAKVHLVRPGSFLIEVRSVGIPILWKYFRVVHGSDKKTDPIIAGIARHGA